MKKNREITSVTKRRRSAKRELGRILTTEQAISLGASALQRGAVETSLAIQSMRGGISVQEAQIFLALADLEIAQRLGPDYAD